MTCFYTIFSEQNNKLQHHCRTWNHSPSFTLTFALSPGLIISRCRSVSGHEVQAKMFPARSPRIRHRSELTERAWENDVQGIGNLDLTYHISIRLVLRKQPPPLGSPKLILLIENNYSSLATPSYYQFFFHLSTERKPTQYSLGSHAYHNKRKRRYTGRVRGI